MLAEVKIRMTKSETRINDEIPNDGSLRHSSFGFDSSFWFGVSSFLLLLCFVPIAQAQDGRRPNILLILADDLGYGDVGFNGRKEWPTTNLDQLARDGTIFRRFYTAGVVCAPARAALLTGRYGIHNGVTGNGSLDLPDEEVTIAEALKPHGYATGIFGKWHHGGPRPGTEAYTHPMDQGFDEFFGFTNATAAHQKFPKKLWDGRAEKESSGYSEALFTDRAIEFLTRQKQAEKNFFCYVPYTNPHSRVEATEEDIARFKGKFPEADPNRPLNATYAAMVYRLDVEVGRLLAALEKLDLARDTIVLFTSDHGATFERLQFGTADFHDSNAPFRGHKRTLWEGGMRVPTVIRWPGKIPAGKTSDAVLHMIDVFPTLLGAAAAAAAAGAEPEPQWKLDGANVLDAWQGKSPAPDRTLFWEWREGGDTQLAAMNGDLKLIVNGGNTPELYNVATDPAERRMIDEQFPQKTKAMTAALNDWLATETDAARQRRKPVKRDGE
jgi:arylsulfatase A-like enzyme